MLIKMLTTRDYLDLSYTAVIVFASKYTVNLTCVEVGLGYD